MSFSFYALCILTISTLVFIFRTMWPLSKKWNPRSQHCYVTGGSSGLGLAVAVALAERGADVSIVARNEERLAKALEVLEKVRQNPNQKLHAYSYSLTDADASNAALEAASKPHGGKMPDAIFLCAGLSTPGFFVEEDARSLRKGMDNTYWVQALTALAYTKHIVQEKKPGKIIFVASVLGYMSFVGFSSYSPGKHALRGLAETLRSELLLYNCSVHIMFPGNIDSPGFVEENRVKPKITLELESTSKPESPETLAHYLIQGVQQGDFHIAPDLITNIFRSSTIGSTPHHNLFLDGIYSIIGFVGLPIWRRGVDSAVLQHRKEHQEYLASKGFFAA